MPARMPASGIMDEDRIIEEVLDKFVNCREQTYEEFLSTFTHLSKEDNVAERGTLGTNSSKNAPTSAQHSHGDEPNSRLGDEAVSFRSPSQHVEEEQIPLGDGQSAGSCFQGRLSRAGKVKVESFLAVEDLGVDEETEPRRSQDWLLPGEVERDVSTCVASYVPSVAQPLSPGAKPRPAVKGVDTPRDEILGDEVQPFHLDDDFDYDTVMLTPKVTPAEIEAIRELSAQKRTNTGTGLEGPRD